MGVPKLLLIPMGEVPVIGLTDTDPNGCTQTVVDPNGCAQTVGDPSGSAACVAAVEDEEEEDEIPLTRKNSQQFIASGESSGVPSPALSALVGLQELFLANFDQTLEDMVRYGPRGSVVRASRWWDDGYLC